MRLAHHCTPNRISFLMLTARGLIINVSEQFIDISVRPAHFLLPTIESEGTAPEGVVHGEFRVSPGCCVDDGGAGDMDDFDPVHARLGEGGLEPLC